MDPGDRIRVLFYIKNLSGGGAERAMADLLTGLDRRRFEPKLHLGSRTGAYLDRVPDADVLEADRAGDGVPGAPTARRRWERLQAAVWARWLNLEIDPRSRSEWTRRRVQGLLDSPKLRALESAIRAFRPHVVVSSLVESAGVYVYLARRRSPVLGRQFRWLAVEQNNTNKRLEAWYEGRELELWRHLTERVYDEADAVAAVSSGVMGGLVERYRVDRSKITVIHNHVDTEAVEAVSPASTGRPFILAAGRLHFQKNFHDLLDAFASLSRRSAVDLVIAGEGEDREELSRRVGALGLADRVHMPGFVDDLWSRMKAASCLAMSSRFEGLPLTLLEAMAAGCPVVAYDCDYGPREIISDGANGLLVPQGDVRALGQAMERVLTEPDLAARLRENGPPRARQFDLETAVSRYESLLHDLATV